MLLRGKEEVIRLQSSQPDMAFVLLEEKGENQIVYGKESFSGLLGKRTWECD